MKINEVVETLGKIHDLTNELARVQAEANLDIDTENTTEMEMALKASMHLETLVGSLSLFRIYLNLNATK